MADPRDLSHAHDQEHHPHDHDRGQQHGDVHDQSPDHDHAHPAGHDHGHPAGHDHDHGHSHGRGPVAWVRELVVPHSHDASDRVDSALEASQAGMRCLAWSFAALTVTAVLQAVVVVFSGSVALLGDTLHNFADALTAVPLGIAFLLGRRVATRSYTYGFGRAEDLAGVAIVLTIFASAALAGWQAIDRLVNPAPVNHVSAVAIAGVLGFIGNEWVAQFRIRVGRKIGSAALVADGLHARTDGFTSLAVVLGAGGVAIGWQWADPVVGLLITLAILIVLKDAAKEVYRRLMDAVDPAIVDQAETTLLQTDGVRAAPSVRVRWIGHQLRAECIVLIDPDQSVVSAHEVAVRAEHALLHAVPRLTSAIIHTDPDPGQEADHHHRELEHHAEPASGLGTRK